MLTFALDIRSPAGSTRVPLQGSGEQSLIVGRAREAQIFLDSRTISRRHAELHCDPFGRWWVRDLGSHNGTLVNGTRVAEHVLKPGDQVQVGEFTLALDMPAAADSRAPAVPGKVPFAEEPSSAAPRVSTLRDFEPPRLAATHLLLLSDLGQELLALPSHADRLAALCAMLTRREFRARSAIALRASKESFTDPPKPLCPAHAAPGDEGLTPYISRTLLRTLLARNEPVLASNATMQGTGGGGTGGGAGGGGGAAMAELSLAADVMTIAAVACPLRTEQAYTDLLYVLYPPEYGNAEWLALTALAVKQFQQAESTWAARKLGEDHAAIERELSRAHEIQKRLIPKDLSIPGLDFAIGFVPCRWVGGDYVDVLKGPDGRVLLAIADVCGKGLPAALVASSLHMLTHTAMRTGMPLPTIMQNLNVYLTESLSEGTFVTMIAAMLDPAAGTLEVINAGHPAGLLISAGGEVTLTQQSANLPLGLDPAAELVGETGRLGANTYLAMFTDGLSELPLESGELLGEDALAEHVARFVRESRVPPAATAVAGQLTALLDTLQTGMSRDDRTFLIARRV